MYLHNGLDENEFDPHNYLTHDQMVARVQHFYEWLEDKGELSKLSVAEVLKKYECLFDDVIFNDV